MLQRIRLRLTGEIWEGYGRDDGRDQNSNFPLYKGILKDRRERFIIFMTSTVFLSPCEPHMVELLPKICKNCSHNQFLKIETNLYKYIIKANNLIIFPNIEMIIIAILVISRSNSLCKCIRSDA